MKDKDFILAVLIVWASVAVAVCFAIYYTHNPKCLLAFLIPALLRYNSKNDNEEKEEE